MDCQFGVYLDNHATTPLDPRVYEAMQPYWKHCFGNPHSSDHMHGWQAAEALEQARVQISALVGAKASQVILTSGATEANNLAIQGICSLILEGQIKPHDGRNKIILAQGEHPCVIKSCYYLQKAGFNIVEIPLKRSGLIDIERFKKAMDAQTIMCCLMFANNEIGTIQPVEELAQFANDKQILFHCDGVQAVGRIPIHFNRSGIASLSVSAHKLYGPMGIGALILSRSARRLCRSIIFGGGQQGDLRSGTVPLALAVGFGKACELAKLEMAKEQTKLSELRAALLVGLDQAGVEYQINGSMQHRLAGNLNLSFKHIAPEKFLPRLNGLSVSTGSACSGMRRASHVLQAIGHKAHEHTTSLRFGFGRFNTIGDVKKALSILCNALKD
ncbi:MAG: cysteine desulfurase family protein [Pseudomonadota bacterium]